MKKVILLTLLILCIGSVNSISSPEYITSNLYLLIGEGIQDVSFSPGITGLTCLPESAYSKNVSVEGQTDDIPLFVFIFTGGTIGSNTLYNWLDVNNPTGFDFKCDIDNTPSDAIILNTTHQIMYENIPESGIVLDIWCWCDFDNPQEYPTGDIFFEVY